HGKTVDVARDLCQPLARIFEISNYNAARTCFRVSPRRRLADAARRSRDDADFVSDVHGFASCFFLPSPLAGEGAFALAKADEGLPQTLTPLPLTRLASSMLATLSRKRRGEGKCHVVYPEYSPLSLACRIASAAIMSSIGVASPAARAKAAGAFTSTSIYIARPSS